MSTIAQIYKISEKEFEKQYKNHLSGFNEWDQKDNADKYMVFPDNMGCYLSLDEIAISNGELYTVLTNKEAHGKKKALVMVCEGTKADDVKSVLSKIPLEKRRRVKEVTLDMSNSMNVIAKDSFPNASCVTDRFHVQQLVTEAVQNIRIDIRRGVIKDENESRKNAKKNGEIYKSPTYVNGDSKKQLLARSRYLLFKPKSKWTKTQNNRSEILFTEYPDLEKAYELSMMFRSVYENSKSAGQAKIKLDEWYKKIESKNIDYFNTAVDTIKYHEYEILNYFVNRSTNASAESFNAKLKGFRLLVRGVRDLKFFMFRVAKLYG